MTRSPRGRTAAAFLRFTLAASLAAGCLGTIQHKRCKTSFDACTNQCEPICDREGSSTHDPYRGDDPGGIRDFNLECSDCVRQCHRQATACDQAEQDRFNQPLP